MLSGDRLYDDSFGLCLLRRGLGPKYDGHDVAWASSLYARALFENEERLDRANHILGRILDHQDTDAGGGTYGNYLATAEWSQVRDANAVSFVVYTLGDLLLHHREKLTEENVRKLKESLRLAAIGLLRHPVPWFYTNIFLLNIAGKLILARILGRDDLAGCAADEWARWRERTRLENICEFNSAAYTPIQFSALLGIEQYAADSAMAVQARGAADYLALTFAAHFHPPTGLLTGTQCRAYRKFLVSGEEGDRPFAFYLFGFPELREESTSDSGREAMLSAAYYTRYDYAAPERALALVRNRTYPLEIVERNASFFGKDDTPGVIVRRSLQTESFTFATQNGVYAHYGHEVPILISVPGSARRLVFVEKRPQYGLVDTYMEQRANMAVGGLYHSVDGWQMLRTWWPGGGPFECGEWFNLGPADADLKVRVADREWDGRDADLEIPAVLAACRGGVMIGLRFLRPPQETRTHPVQVRLKTADGDVVVALSFLCESDVETVLRLPPAVIGLVIAVEVGEPERLNSWSDYLSAQAITSEEADGIWRVGWEESGKTVIAEVPLTAEARERLRLRNVPPITEPLFECSGVCIRSADLM